MSHGAGGAAFIAIYLWENKKEEEQISRITRDETLSRLPVRLANNRTVELSALRENTRPVSFYLLQANYANPESLSSYQVASNSTLVLNHEVDVNWESELLHKILRQTSTCLPLPYDLFSHFFIRS